MKRSKKIAGIFIILLAGYAPQGMTQETDEVLINSPTAVVTQADFEAEIERIPEEHRFEFRASPARVGAMVDQIYVNRYAAQQARKSGMDQDPLLKKKLQLAEDALLAGFWFNQLKTTAKLPDFEQRAREIHKGDPDRFMTQRMVSVSHVLISLKNRSEEDALKRAQEVRAKALHGEPFAKLAGEYSDDPSAKQNGGDLGYFAADRMVKAFSEVAFAMKDGDISEPFKTEFGYHVVLFQGSKPAELKKFEAVKDGLIEELKNNYLADIRRKAVSEIREDKTREVNNEAISRLQTVLPVSATKRPGKE